MDIDRGQNLIDLDMELMDLQANEWSLDSQVLVLPKLPDGRKHGVCGLWERLYEVMRIGLRKEEACVSWECVSKLLQAQTRALRSRDLWIIRHAESSKGRTGEWIGE